MSTYRFTGSQIARPAHLAACLAAALGLTLSAARASDVSRAQMPFVHGHSASLLELPHYLRGAIGKAHAPRQHMPDHPAAPHVVTTCADDGSAGSLRSVIGAAGTVSGDTINLSTLSCSTITLDQNQGAIAVNQDSLYLMGPTPGSGNPLLTIDADNHSPVFNHFHHGILKITDLTIANGYVISSYSPTGGCIYSAGSVYLANSVVSHCILESSSNSVAAKGAGVYAQVNLTLVNSTITDSHVFAPDGADARGGGAFVINYFQALYSTISNNTANALIGGVGYAGGALAVGGVDIENSTISGNQAQIAGARRSSVQRVDYRQHDIGQHRIKRLGRNIYQRAADAHQQHRRVQPFAV